LINRSFAYLDTSTWIKLYVRESGSEVARRLIGKYRVLSSAILLTESFSALSRKKEIREIDGSQLKRMAKMMKDDVRSVEIINVSDSVLGKSEEIVLTSMARTLDAIHIASALIFQDMTEIEVTFITSDRKQYEIAQEKGLKAVLVT
jgi:predicted nucleic acid-binding protein